MKEFFKVADVPRVMEYAHRFPTVSAETVPLSESYGRILAEAVVADLDLPGFSRSTMDGYAVPAASTFGASESNPAFLNVTGEVFMGETPRMTLGPGQAVRIPTGAMLPEGADAVVMIEHAEALDETTIEVYRSVAPGQHVIEKGEDFSLGETILEEGRPIRFQEAGLLAAFGRTEVRVFRKPIVGIISTGDEIVPVDHVPKMGQIRDINSTTLSGQVQSTGGVAEHYGIVEDTYDALYDVCRRATATSDMVLVSGGSSVGARDFTIEALGHLPDAEILVHGMSLRPGKPTILARIGDKPVWGLPGHVVSAMIVFTAVVEPFLKRIGGVLDWKENGIRLSARMSRNVASAQGRIDYVRVKLRHGEGILWADPLLAKSGLIHTMVHADGLVAIGMNDEGLDEGDTVEVIPI